ncbi:hypothetical protein [Streptomyces sp. MMS24-I29]|uniref:hypothetical protein n=2 Tax=Streptomyces TaxID=1883 RepID=UPI00093B1426|nr:hypothetical protein AMK22_32105 [Streptomyces sp. CB01580]
MPEAGPTGPSDLLPGDGVDAVGDQMLRRAPGDDTHDAQPESMPLCRDATAVGTVGLERGRTWEEEILIACVRMAAGLC